MWKKLKQAATNCFVCFAKCGRLNSSIEDDLAEILENLVDDADELPAHLGLHMPYYVAAAAATSASRTRPLLHRPDVACARRSSAPEVLERLRRALRELGEAEEPPGRAVPPDACRLLCLYDPSSGFVDRQPAPTDCF